MSSEVNTTDLTVTDETYDVITHLRTDDGSLRYPISIADAIYVDGEEKINLTTYLQQMGTNTLYAKQVFAVEFSQDSDGYYSYEFQNPFETNKLICNIQNTNGDNLICASTITPISVKFTLVEPEDCWIYLTGEKIGEVVVDAASTDVFSHSHTNKVTLDRLGNLDGRLTYSGNAIAYESLIGDLSKINGNNIVDILLEICDRLNIDLGEPTIPDMPESDPVITSPTSTNIQLYSDETVSITYTITSDTVTNKLHIILDDEESVQEISVSTSYLRFETLGIGTYSLVLFVEDGNGRTSSNLTFNIIITDVAEKPVEIVPDLVTTVSPILSFSEADEIEIDYAFTSITENNNLYYYIDKETPSTLFLDGKEVNGTLKLNNIPAGNHTFYMYVMDANLNKSDIISISLIVSEVSDAPTETKLDSIIINQFYSSGGKDDGPVSHNFIELYNTSDEDVNIYNLVVHAGTSNNIWYRHKVSTSHKANEDTKELILPGHTSFLILMKQNDNNPNSDGEYFCDFNLAEVSIGGNIYDLTKIYDDSWTTTTLSNKYLKIFISTVDETPTSYNPLEQNGLIDCAIAVNSDSKSLIEEGLTEYCFIGLSKQKSIRRINFTKTSLSDPDDFEYIDFNILANAVYSPRCIDLGSWTEPEKPDYGDDKIDPIGIPVIKLFMEDDQVQKLTSGKKGKGTIWYYDATVGNRGINAYFEMKYQNYSGEAGQKENFKIDLFSDAECSLELDEKFDTEGFSGIVWPKLDNYVLKGNRKDPSHAHNIVTSNIIRQSYAENHIITPADDDTRYGIIDGFPIILYINNEKQGIYTLNMPQNRKVYGIEKNDYTPAMFRGTSNDGDVHESVRFLAHCTDTSDTGYQWEDRYPEAYDDIDLALYGETNLNNLNKLISFVKDTDEDFMKNLPSHMDVDYAIDYFIWMYFGGFVDSAANNLNLLSYDGNVYIPTFYDMDATFGLNHKGTEMISTDADLFTDYRTTDSALWEKLFIYAEDAIKSRYQELRSTTMNKEYILSEFDRFWAIIPEEEQAYDEQKWSSSLMGSSNRFATHRSQLEAWLTSREVWCDEQILGN